MKKLKLLPEALQKQILLRFALAAALLILGTASAILLRDKSVLVIFAVALFCAGQGVWICLRPYIVIKGTVREVTLTPVRRRSKSILLQTEMGALRISLKQRLRKFSVGEPLELYVDAATQIYEWDGEFRLQSYISVDRPTKSCYTKGVK
jgi:hypothetical protein